MLVCQQPPRFLHLLACFLSCTYIKLGLDVLTIHLFLLYHVSHDNFISQICGGSCVCRDRVRSSDIQKDIRGELLLAPVERSQLRWFMYLIKMPPGHLALEVFQARPAGRRPRGRPKTRWKEYPIRPEYALGSPRSSNWREGHLGHLGTLFDLQALTLGPQKQNGWMMNVFFDLWWPQNYQCSFKS